ncbi:hypothetical protein J2S35_001656 [Falsarthrobacter nasiphocae]|uniref:Uncharacterized protein n=1 Tax=Falsarthrobacter nasiphocae TaxID=189863 RepID=A0AAE4C6T4_9MICC|nr:hypothetical protein [Falsarthrobacter nasiphocae]MDR6892014.1 hypothetical protein [Falsarthrobacter nasiphocae]MDR6892716.1 hypothetical protein [Falsarthrobacter nasiphocae]
MIAHRTIKKKFSNIAIKLMLASTMQFSNNNPLHTNQPHTVRSAQLQAGQPETHNPTIQQDSPDCCFRTQ